MANLQLPELDTRTVLEVVEENFQALNLKTYTIRLIYAGEHTLPKEELIRHFKRTTKDVNSRYCEIYVYGLLLVYDSYFVCIIEGSEDTVHRHLRFLFRREEESIKNSQKVEDDEGTVGLSVILAEEEAPKPEEKCFFKRLKVLMYYHSVKTLLFTEWRIFTAKPPSLVGKLDIYGPLEEHMEQLKICLVKIKNLCEFATKERDLSFEGLSAVDPRMEALPEVVLLDFLLQSKYLFDLRTTFSWHRRVDDYRFFHEEVWPLLTHYTPRLLYKLKIDDSFVEPLEVMPWEIQAKEEKEGDDEGQEDASEASSSD